MAELRAILHVDEKTEWRIAKAWTKRKKVLFEVEESNPLSQRSFIGRIVSEDRNRACFQALERLWAGGLCPPSAFTVPQPVGHLPNWRAILQEKAPGDLLRDVFAGDAGVARRGAELAGEWLNALHSLPLETSARNDVAVKLDIWCAALRELSPQHSKTLEKIHRQITVRLLEEAPALVPSHGDFHATNILISPAGRVTGIDFDNFGGRERSADLGYFLGQTAARGFRKTGSFEASTDVRTAFIRGYETAAGRSMPSQIRIGSFAAAAFLRLLHDDLCLMRSGRIDLITPWLTAAVALSHGRDLESTR